MTAATSGLLNVTKSAVQIDAWTGPKEGPIAESQELVTLYGENTGRAIWERFYDEAA